MQNYPPSYSYTQAEEDAIAALLEPDKRLEVIRIMRCIQDKGVRNSRHNKRIELVEYEQKAWGRIEHRARLEREKQRIFETGVRGLMK